MSESTHVVGEPEVVQPEVVDHQQADAGVATVDPAAPSALERATEAALAMPGMPGRDEFLSLAAQARMLSLSAAAPKAVRENPFVAFHVAMVGRDLGISPSAAIELIDVIETKGGFRISLSPQLLNGQVRRLGLGSIVAIVRTNELAVAAAVGPRGIRPQCRALMAQHPGTEVHVDGCDCDVLGLSEFTWEDARIATLVGPQCEPGQHVKTRRQSGNRTWDACGCNQGYQTYPKRMLWWRASGFAVDDYFPEAGLGLYTAEELGSVVDADGRPIDPSTVALPPGYEDPRQLNQARAAETQAQRDQPADPADLWELQELIAALPEGAQENLRQAWQGDESRVRGIPARVMPRRLMPTAKALVNAHWAQARKAGVDRDQALADVRAQEVKSLVLALSGPRRPGPAAKQALSGPESASNEAPAPAPHPSDLDERTDAQAPESGDVTDEPFPRDWTLELRTMATEVRTLAKDVPANVVERITADVSALHHTKVNAELEVAGVAGDYPPDEAPIDLRRMAITALRLEAFKASGVVPGGADA